MVVVYLQFTRNGSTLLNESVIELNIAYIQL